MNNIEYYNKLISVRETLNARTKEMEKVIFSPTQKVGLDYIRDWHNTELKRRHFSYKVAVAFQNLTPDERKIVMQNYQNQD